jgi:ABC-2 type transport system ATP-binding protein
MIRQIRDVYRTTVFMTTHYLEEADELSDTICILKDGRSLVQDSPEHLRKYTRQNIIRIKIDPAHDIEPFENWLSEQRFVTSISHQEYLVSAIVLDPERDLISVNQALLDRSVPFRSISLIEPSLEDVYLQLNHTQGA